MVSCEIISKVLNEVDPDELIGLTTDMLKINSVWNPVASTSEQPAAKLAPRWAEKQGFEVLMEEVARSRPNAIVTWTASPGERTMMFEGHTDVVTRGNVSGWRYDSFGAEIIGRWMYGRGTSDTKGNLVAMLIAMAALKRSGVKLGRTIIRGTL